MNYKAFFTIVLFISTNSFSQTPMPSTNILSNTFYVNTDTLSGTCFVINQSDQEYVVTVRHLFKKNVVTGDSVAITINLNKKLVNVMARIFFHPNPMIDVAIMKINSKISKPNPLSLAPYGQAILGQQCIFLGYPISNLIIETRNERIPLVKRAIISAFYKENEIDIWLLDGHNNSGFSGGPIVSYGIADKIDNQMIYGIIAGYIFENRSVKHKNTDGSKEEFMIEENSGIIYAYPAKYILETITSIKN